MNLQFHSKGINLGLEVLTKHLLCDSEYAFCENDLELRADIYKITK